MAELFPSIWKSKRDKTESTFPLRNPTSPFSQKCDLKKEKSITQPLSEGCSLSPRHAVILSVSLQDEQENSQYDMS